MKGSTRVALYCAMVLFTIVSMWTTYKSLTDSILPEPAFDIPLGNGVVWEHCAIFALALSVAVGLMLFALKLAIIDGQKRLNLLGVIGLTIIAAISISFNMDVLYRTADKEFFLKYSDQRMRDAYVDYLGKVQAALGDEKEAIQRKIDMQEGELEAEIRGLRKLPEGYGSVARKEDYTLLQIQKESQAELERIDQALETKREADVLLQQEATSLDEIHQLQEKVRVLVKDIGPQVGIPLPPAVKLETPLFAVFSKLFDFRHVGPMEILILFLAFLLDLGDIIGYSLIPNKAPKAVLRPAWATSPEHLSQGPEIIRDSTESSFLESADRSTGTGDNQFLPSTTRSPESSVPVARFSGERRRRPFRFRRR